MHQPRNTGFSRRSRSASVRCLALRVSVRTLSMIDASAFFDG